MKKTTSILFYALIMGLLVLSNSCKKDDDNDPNAVKDADGNVYKTVVIGTQTWMVENLRTTKYNDGTAIPLVTDNSAWKDLTSAAYSNYKNTANNDTIATFGRLYNWYAVNTGNLCPTGWHVPTDAEWTTLTTDLGGESEAGGKLKEIGTTHWQNPNKGATNETGFTALPSGLRDGNGAFDNVGYYGYWWSATETDATKAWYRLIYYNYSNVYRGNGNKELGFSVRCIAD
ncbi:MAG: fibrobacter succinogenes major paralogous domain-containing protein [Bacteroidales bacterium]|nr:fibrobacter succinogenes major paralogous domain-containing protein [Bacteroidales bacterium]